VMTELLPRLQALATVAHGYDIGLNIDAEEVDRLELSLDLVEQLCTDASLAGWSGIGFVVQAYQKRAPYVIDFLVDLARRTGHRLMVRLVKGAYWDAEIKRAQVDGLEGFPVYTRKVHTDVAYLACARRLLAAPDAVFPQFATHNARTLASILEMGSGSLEPGRYEFQCLHGMGEALYEEIVGPEKLDRPCRIYAPVGTHETLLAYLVRRLLENGANTSFVNRIADRGVAVDELVADPVTVAATISPLGTPHERIALPRALYGPMRTNSAGVDFSNEQRLASLSAALLRSAECGLRAGAGVGPARPVSNPADRRDVVGHVVEADDAEVDAAIAAVASDGAAWQATLPTQRAACLLRAADAIEADGPALMATIVREAGRTIPNAQSEVREAADFLRYYAAQIRQDFPWRPLGPIACISPWNFPLAIFVGQIAAALAAGNPVLAKPAEETPLIAAEAVRRLHAAGVPSAALALLPGDGRVGAWLVADPRVRGVMFTGSSAVARLIARSLAERLDPDGRPIPLIAETGGQNAMIVDSSALPEQVVADAITSAFDSAGQRCSALRVLCLQEEIADRMLEMLLGAMAELGVGNPDRLATDIGPVITEAARATLGAHIDAMRARGRRVHQATLPAACRHGSFFAPAVIEIERISELTGEVFGPVLHVLRYRRDALEPLVKEIAATGYALTFGVHSRIDETILPLSERAPAGNIYINRNLIGAVVGVQPFGGHALSGTGPKAGGPLMLRRLARVDPAVPPLDAAPSADLLGPAHAFADLLEERGVPDAAAQVRAMIPRSRVGAGIDLPGPVGERNVYALHPRGPVICIASNPLAMACQIGAALASGNAAEVLPPPGGDALLTGLPTALRDRIHPIATPDEGQGVVVLHEGDADALDHWQRVFAAREGPIVPFFSVPRGALVAGAAYDLTWLLEERSVSTNTAAAGGNASLMTIG
jgi:RHH-type proline utilization regulon transcriptional repressor/proline dehydrogenase/delta 1-pyrroline-5-carboxylate dehydrogenase